jgi:dihydroorotase
MQSGEGYSAASATRWRRAGGKFSAYLLDAPQRRAIAFSQDHKIIGGTIMLSRRDFLASTAALAASAGIGGAHAAMGPDDKFDLLIKGGDVLDPSQSLRGRRDVGIRFGVVEAVEPEIAEARALRVINASGKLVTPGLVDLHSHVYPYGSAIGIPADESVVNQCATTCVSAGDAGANNFAAFRRFIVGQTRTRLYAFVHIANVGLTPFPVAELYNIDFAQVDACAKTIDENADIALGAKVRMSENVIAKHGTEPLKRAILACEKSGTGAKIMCHIGGVETGALMSQILDLLRPGDILTHSYSGAPNIAGAFTNIVQEGKLLPAALAAKQRGVIFDVGTWRRQLRLHRCGDCDPGRMRARYHLVGPSRGVRQYAGHALSSLGDVQVHGARLLARTGGRDGDDQSGENHQPRTEARHVAGRRAG